MPSGSAGLIGSINPSLPIDLTPISSTGANYLGDGTFSSSPIVINSPGSPTLSTGTTGILFWLAIGVVGIILLFRGDL